MTHPMSEPRLEWKPIDDQAKDGREILLRRGSAGSVYMGYFGMAPQTHGAGATPKYPWTILDNTNGVNHVKDGGEDGVTHYAEVPR